MEKIKVSIIMPIYNVERYLKKCFDSVLASTLKDIEIIAIDDGAKDSSGQIIDQYASKDSRVIPIHKENGGYGSAINEGLKIAKGEFVAILETDDWVTSDMYEILYNKAKEFDVDCLKGNFFYCPDEYTNIEHKFLDSLPIEKPFNFKEHIELLLFAPSIWSAIYKREFLDQKNIKCTQKVSPYEDLPFALEVYSKAEKIVLINNPLYFYRCEPKQGSSTMRNDRKLFRIIEQIQNTIDIAKEIKSFDYVKETLYKHIYNSMFLFVGNAHKELKKELFCEFGNFFKVEDSKDLKYTYFNKNEMKIVNALKTHNYFYFKNLKKIMYLKKHPLLINSKMLKSIFSVKNEGYHKVVTILGIKFKKKNKFKELYAKIEEQKETILMSLNNVENCLEEQKNEINELQEILTNRPVQNINKHLFDYAGMETAKYIIENMPTAPIFNNSLELLTYALSKVNNNGLHLEFGVYSGNTINHIAIQKTENKIYGFDSFEGLPEDWRSEFKEGMFLVDNLPKVEQNVELIKGWFCDTLPEFTKEHNEQCAFLHIDCDIYSSTKTVFNALDNQIVSGTIIVFDEYFNYPNWQEHEFKAFQEFIKKKDLKYEYLGYVYTLEQVAVRII